MHILFLCSITQPAVPSACTLQVLDLRSSTFRYSLLVPYLSFAAQQVLRTLTIRSSRPFRFTSYRSRPYRSVPYARFTFRTNNTFRSGPMAHHQQHQLQKG